MQKAQHREPGDPENYLASIDWDCKHQVNLVCGSFDPCRRDHNSSYLVQVLDVDDAKHKYELVEDKVPKLVFHVLE